MSDIPWDDLMDAAGGSDFAPFPQGDYDVKIIETEATKSSTDKPMWKLTCQVINGPHEGRKVWTQQTLTMENPDALAVFFRQMAAAGLTGEFFKTKPSNQKIADALLGRTFRAKIIINEWQGVPRNKIKQWNPAGAGAGVPGGPGGPPPPPGAGAAAGGPPPPPATSPPSGPPPPPPASSAPPASAGAPPATATPPQEPTSAPPASAPAAAAPPAPEPAPPAPAPAAETSPQPPTNGATATPEPPPLPAAPAGGGEDPWVVQPRETGSTEPPPF